LYICKSAVSNKLDMNQETFFYKCFFQASFFSTWRPETSTASSTVWCQSY